MHGWYSLLNPVSRLAIWRKTLWLWAMDEDDYFQQVDLWHRNHTFWTLALSNHLFQIFSSQTNSHFLSLGSIIRIFSHRVTFPCLRSNKLSSFERVDVSLAKCLLTLHPCKRIFGYVLHLSNLFGNFLFSLSNHLFFMAFIGEHLLFLNNTRK